MVDHARETLNREARKAADAGLEVAIENHQDFCSEELMALAEGAGPNVGIALDTGNPFAVAEDPVAFAKRVAPRLKHVHLKDYVSQFTSEGFRPFAVLSAMAASRGDCLIALPSRTLTASTRLARWM
jgi:sugar phosphate isomerase/epimerase